MFKCKLRLKKVVLNWPHKFNYFIINMIQIRYYKSIFFSRKWASNSFASNSFVKTGNIECRISYGPWELKRTQQLVRNLCNQLRSSHATCCSFFSSDLQLFLVILSKTSEFSLR